MGGINMEKESPVYLGTKKVGTIKGRTFTKNIRGYVHILRSPEPSLCNDRSVLARLDELGITTIKVYDIHTDITYTTTLENIYKNGELIDKGYGIQYRLPLTKWKKSGGKKERWWNKKIF